MGASRSGTSKIRVILRPFKRMILRPTLARALHRRKWEQKWGRSRRFGWEVEGVAPELASAVQSGFLRPEMSVLDIGCGTGTSAAWMAAQGFRVLGVDVSDRAINQARETHSGHGDLTFDKVDITAARALDGQTFDALVDRGCLHTLPDAVRQDYAANVAKWAKPGAPFLLTMHMGSGQGVEVRQAQLARLLGAEFTIEDFEKIDRIYQRGERSADGVAFHLRRLA